MIYLILFYKFFLIGLFAIGGGMATVPFVQHLGEQTSWFTQQELLDMLVVSTTVPGPIGVNLAAYIGYNQAGILGAISTVGGIVAPSIIIIILIAGFLAKFKSNLIIKKIFYGIKPVVTGLIAATALKLTFDTINFKELINFEFNNNTILFGMLSIILIVNFIKAFHPIIYIIAAGVFGILFFTM